MYQPFNPSRRRNSAGRSRGYFTLLLAALLLTIVAPCAFAQTHVGNPYVGAMVYASPDYTTEVAAAVATEPAGSALANSMTVVGQTPTFVWLDRIAAIYGGSVNSGRLSLQGHINAAVAQAKGAEIVVQLVIYDLPDRDCAALASNGELSIAGGDTPRGYTTPLVGTGIQEYENDYITPIYNILAAAPSNVRFVLVIEDDSLPNMVTNTGYSYALANCVAANDGESYPTLSMQGVYVLCIQYSLNQFHKLPNVYNYLDIGHHGWLGWPEGAAIAFPYYADVLKGTTAGFPSLDGIITNTANYGPTKEPYMSWNTVVPGGTAGNVSDEVYTGTFYSWNPSIDELSYAQQFYTGLTGAGFPTSLGFLIDTSRNGWGGTARPTGPGASTIVNTFVNETKIDERDDMGQWCNQENQGIGSLPTVNPITGISAYVWVKPPGESDGDYPNGDTNPLHPAGGGDENCDPAHSNALANNMVVGSIPNSPPAGAFWLTEFLQDVQNAYPPLPTTTAPGYTVSATATTVMQGTSVPSSVTVGAFNGFENAVALTVSALPAGVTASFSSTSVTGSGGSTLTFTASNTAAVGTYTLTVTGTSGSTVETAKLALTVTARPEFTITVAPAALTLPVNTNPTVTLTVTFVGGLTGNVTLSASGLPSGVGANFAPSSMNASGACVVNFTSQTSTPGGTYNILLTGTDGTLVNSATLALTIPTMGFSLAPKAPTLTIAQGASANDTITVTDVNGFNGNVALAASGLPTGVTASFNPSATTGTSTLTLTASSTATAGAATVTITGTSGTIVETTSIALTVTGTTPPSFTLTPATVPFTIAQGASGTDTITITDAGGFTGSVTLSASGVPAGVTCSFGTSPATTTTVLTCAASATAAAGSYQLMITGTSGTTTATTNLPLTVTASAPPPSFTLSSTGCTAVQGGTGTGSVVVTDVNGFTGSVTLSASGLPSGVTLAFAPNPTTGSSTITCSASATATAGSSTMTITGTSGALTANASTVLTVTAKTTVPSFSLAPSAATLSVAQGSSGTDTVTVTDAGGFTGAVTLAISGLPSGVTAAIGANPATTASVITFTASSTATVGTSTITITGTSGSLSATTPIALTVTSVSCTPTPINAQMNVGGVWIGESSATVSSTTAVVDLGPQPLTGTWSWIGPNGFTSTLRELDKIALSVGVNVYTATYTNSCGAKTTQAFTITVTGSTGSFSLAASPTTLSVTQGASVTDTITVTDVSPFAGSVTLAASGLPSGVTAAFGANPATTTSVLTLTASSTAATGSSTVTISGTSGTLAFTTTIPLTVNAASTGSFKLTPSPTTCTLPQGGSCTDTITVTDTAPFNGSVTLAASGLPAGVTAVFGTNPATATSVITFTASSTAATGTSTVTITGTSGALTATTTISLTVTPTTVSGAKCTVDYVISPQNTSAFGANITIVNNSSTAWTSWTLTWAFANGQTVSQLWNGNATQSGANVTVTSESYNGAVAAGGTVSGVGFNGTWNGTTNTVPTAFSINGTACTVN